ncbi:HAD family hydrolase [bacterium 1XD42-8]|jgi:HAD superfamily hydrolase (TIGR01549 family)|nr:HAD family hydrolase [Lachnospiraceae bacterium]RKJ40151.1 HAD family hydrolase [bacterium 1XD42-8]
MPVKMHIEKKLKDYKAVIFDLDGTLYFQNQLRIHMAMRLVKYYALHPFQLKDLMLLRKFRLVREEWETLEVPEDWKTWSMDQAQYAYVAKKMKSTRERVEKIVERWMYEQPLKTLFKCRDEKLAYLMTSLREEGIPVLVYSDYPVKEKLKALEIRADGMYSALDREIMSLKPEPKGLIEILRQWELKPSEAVMIGDRDCKDGQAARNVGMDYIILEKKKGKRKLLYEQLWR